MQPPLVLSSLHYMCFALLCVPIIISELLLIGPAIHMVADTINQSWHTAWELTLQQQYTH